MEPQPGIGHRASQAVRGLLDTCFSRTLAGRAALLILYAGAVLWGGYDSLSRLHEDLSTKRAARLARTAATMAQTLDAFFLERVGELQMLAHLPGIGAGAPQTASESLQRFIRLSRHFSGARIITAQGATSAASDRSLQGAPSPDWIQDVHRTGRPRLVPPRGSGAPVVTVVVPIERLQGPGPGVLSGAIPVQTVHRILQERFTLLAQESRAEGWVALDPMGILVADQQGPSAQLDDLRRLGQASALHAARAASPEGRFLEELDVRTRVPVVTGFARLARHDPIQGFGWTVLVQAHRAALYGPVNRFLVVAGTALTILAGIAGYLGLLALQSLQGDPGRHGQDPRLLTGPTYYDAVTGLPGDRLFEMIVGQAIDRAAPGRRTMGLLTFDLKQLRIVSDHQGKARGDLAVRVLAARVKSGIRMSDTVARTGTDRFAVLLENLSAPEDAASIAQTILQTVVLPLTIGSEEILIDTRIGIALYPSDATAATDLMACAEHAMATAQAEEVPISFHSRTLGERIFEGLAQEREQAADSASEDAVFRL